MTDAYAFRSVWRLPASPARCWAETERMLRPGARSWWPGVRAEGAPRIAEGATIVLVVTAPLGYRLRVRLRPERVDAAARVEAEASGDLSGSGILTLAPLPGEGCRMQIDWRVRLRRPWMRRTSWMLRPVFRLAHAVVMRRGERGLLRALDAA